MKRSTSVLCTEADSPLRGQGANEKQPGRSLDEMAFGSGSYSGFDVSASEGRKATKTSTLSTVAPSSGTPSR